MFGIDQREGSKATQCEIPACLREISFHQLREDLVELAPQFPVAQATHRPESCYQQQRLGVPTRCTSRRRSLPTPVSARAQICPVGQMQFEEKRIFLSWVSVCYLAPCLVKNGKMAVEDVEEPADDVLVRAVSGILSEKNCYLIKKYFGSSRTWASSWLGCFGSVEAEGGRTS